MSNKPHDKQIPLEFWLGYTVEEIKSLPDPFNKPCVMDGAEIKIALPNMWGGWELTENGPQIVWFLVLNNGKMERLNSAF